MVIAKMAKGQLHANLKKVFMDMKVGCIKPDCLGDCLDCTEVTGSVADQLRQVLRQQTAGTENPSASTIADVTAAVLCETAKDCQSLQELGVAGGAAVKAVNSRKVCAGSAWSRRLVREVAFRLAATANVKSDAVWTVTVSVGGFIHYLGRTFLMAISQSTHHVCAVVFYGVAALLLHFVSEECKSPRTLQE